MRSSSESSVRSTVLLTSCKALATHGNATFCGVSLFSTHDDPLLQVPAVDLVEAADGDCGELHPVVKALGGGDHHVPGVVVPDDAGKVDGGGNTQDDERQRPGAAGHRVVGGVGLGLEIRIYLQPIFALKNDNYQPSDRGEGPEPPHHRQL